MPASKHPVWLAIVLAICGLGVWGAVLQVPRLAWVPLVALLPAAWAAWDARHLRAQEYYTSLAVSPAMLFWLVALCWVVVLPWYLSVREQIRSGRALRRPPPRVPSDEPAA
jgi:hypothetical protein